MSMPQTEVSYAPTKAFQEAFPGEAQAQAAKFTQPTWASAPGVAAFATAPTTPVFQGATTTTPPTVQQTDPTAFIIGAVLGAAAIFILYYAGKNFVLPLVFGNGQVE